MVPALSGDGRLYDSTKPTWEKYNAHLSERKSLEAERDDLSEFQETLDQARAAIADGPISEAELHELESDLAESMPPAVAKRLSGSDPGTANNLARDGFAAAAQDRPQTELGADFKPADDLTL